MRLLCGSLLRALAGEGDIRPYCMDQISVEITLPVKFFMLRARLPDDRVHPYGMKGPKGGAICKHTVKAAGQAA
jgi:hypothetical protein